MNELRKALVSYVVITILIFIFMIYFIKLEIIHSLVFSLILGQIFLNFIFIPTKYNIFSEFCNANAFYIFIQNFTPIVVYIYALYFSVKSKNLLK